MRQYAYHAIMCIFNNVSLCICCMSCTFHILLHVMCLLCSRTIVACSFVGPALNQVYVTGHDWSCGMHYQLRPPSVTQQHFCRLTLSRRSALLSWQPQNGSEMLRSKTSSGPCHRFRFSVNVQCYKYRNSHWADNRIHLHYIWNADLVAWFHLGDKSFQDIMYPTSSGKK